jgi:AraC-like DNA-binding protein
MVKKILLLLLPITLLGQINDHDLKKLSYDKLKSLFFENENKPEKQTPYAKAFLSKAQIEKNNRQIARGYYWFSLMNKGDKAIMYLDSVIKYSTNTNDPSFPIAAYCEKAAILSKKSKHQEALNNFLLAEKYALKNNRKDDYYAILFYIAATKSENLGEVSEALDQFKICYKYLKSKDTRSPQYSVFYRKVLFSIADAYTTLHQSDSATYYNKQGIIESRITNDQDYITLFTLNEAANLVFTKKYKTAIDTIYKIFPKIIKSNDQENIMAGYYYLGKAYAGIQKQDKATENFIKVDSMYNVIKIMYPEITGVYPFLINHYKNKGNKDKQLEYITKYMKIDDSLQKSRNKMYKLLVKEYDIPHLVKDKENLIKSLQEGKVFYYWGIGAVLLIAVGLGTYSFYQSNLNRKYKARFEQIMVKESSIDIIPTNENNIEVKEIKSKDIYISPEKTNELLEQLAHFEKNKHYLKQNIVVQSLSDEFGTNTKYLSTIVNVYKKKRFVDYINDLRIDDAVLCLQKDNNLKKFTIEALANEFGFNNAESFSNAFYKRTGLKPSFFIKELENK